MASDSELLQVLSEQNPWHERGEVPVALARRSERRLGRSLWRRLGDDELKRFHLILGPRRVGKTTALYQTVRHLLAEGGVPPRRVWWMRLDHPHLRQTDLGTLVRLIIQRCGATAENPAYLMLDELVYATDWDLWLKTFHDDSWPVRIAATSSATAALRDRQLESGVGRWADHYLMPYSFGEFLGLMDRSPPIAASGNLRTTIETLAPTDATDAETAELRELFMLVGGFPELLTSIRGAAGEEVASLSDRLLESQQILRTDAVERAVYKDIPQTFKIDNPMLLERLLYVLAAQMTGIMSPQKLTGELGTNQATLDRYLSYLEQAFLVFTLTNWSPREASMQKRGRKLFFADGAIRNAALQRGLRPLTDPIEKGALIENLVASTLRSVAIQAGARLHYWRDKKSEVDFVFDQAGGALAIEVGSSDSHSRAGLIALAERFPACRGACWLVTPNSPLLSSAQSKSGVGSMPLDLFLLAASAQENRDLSRRLGVSESGRNRL